MIQGTTPTMTFRLPFDSSRLIEAEFTISDYDNVVRIWKLNEMTVERSSLKIEFTEDETLKLEPRLHNGQLRVKMLDGKILATKIFPISVSDLLSEVKI